MKKELVVLGGGPGGYAAAFMAADLGMEGAIVERRPTLGGVCLLEGCIPSKALLHAAETIAAAERAAEWGISFDRPDIDLDRLRDRKSAALDRLAGGLDQLAQRRKVQVVHAVGTLDGPSALRLEGDVDDERLEFDRLILAVGSSVTQPGPLGLDSDLVMRSTEALELPEVPDSLLVVGGGYIGLEMGTLYARLGSKVTVVEMLDGLLPGADRDLVRPLRKVLDDLFEDILLETKVAELKEVDGGIEATLDTGDGDETRRFDRVLVSVGRRPNSEGIGLDAAGVEVDDDGFVIVDDARHTTADNIYAVGDLIGQPMLAHKAFHDGYVAAERAAGRDAAFDPRAIPAVMFTEPEVAWAGLTELEAKRRGIDVEVARYPWAASGRAQSIGRPEGMTKMLFDPDTDRVLGVGIVGADAGELISEGVLAIEMGCRARDLAETIHPHPTLSETLSGAAEVHLGVATEVYRKR